jgi:hypothetical protein
MATSTLLGYPLHPEELWQNPQNGLKDRGIRGFVRVCKLPSRGRISINKVVGYEGARVPQLRHSASIIRPEHRPGRHHARLAAMDGDLGFAPRRLPPRNLTGGWVRAADPGGSVSGLVYSERWLDATDYPTGSADRLLVDRFANRMPTSKPGTIVSLDRRRGGSPVTPPEPAASGLHYATGPRTEGQSRGATAGRKAAGFARCMAKLGCRGVDDPI